MPSRYLTSDNYVVDTLTVNGVTVTSGDIAAYDPTTVSGAVASGNAALVSANTAQASGNAALTVTTTALASGNAAISVSNSALASGNLALTYLVGASGVPGAWARLTASVAVTSGNAVGLTDQGTIEPTRTIAVTPASTPTLSSVARVTTNSISDQSSTAYSTVDDTFLTVYPDSSLSNYGSCVAYKLTSSGTFDKGSPVVFHSTPVRAISCDYSPLDNVFGVLYAATLSSNPTTVAVQTSGLLSLVGSPSTINSDTIPSLLNTSLSYSQPANCFLGAHGSSLASNISAYSFVYSCTNTPGVVGTLSYTRGNVSPVAFTAGGSAAGYVTTCTHPLLQLGYLLSTNTNGIHLAVFGLQDKILQYTYGGNDVAIRTIVSTSTGKIESTYDYINDRLVIGYVDRSASSALKALVIDTSKSSVGFNPVGSAATVSSNSCDDIALVYDYPNARVHFAYSDASSNDNLKVAVGSVSNVTLTLGSAVSVTNSSSYSYSAAYSTAQKKPVITFANSQAGNALNVFSSSTGSGTQYYPQIAGYPSYVGVAQATITGGQQVTVALSRSIDKNQSGLTTGKYQYVNYSASGAFTTSPTKPTYWPAYEAWQPVAQSISSSTIILLNSY